MESRDIDQLFKDNTEQMQSIPEDANWDSGKGWNDYKQAYGRNQKRKLLIVSSVAASIAIALFFSVMLTQNKIVTLANNTNEAKRIELPDGNLAWLNRNSNIAFPSKSHRKRAVYRIEGEVFFELIKLRKSGLVIEAENILIEAESPTNFNVKCYPTTENIDVTIETGVLKITEKDASEGFSLLVREDNYCSIHKSKKLVYTAPNSNQNYLAWKTGKLVFDNNPIANVLDVLEDYYGTKILVNDQSIAYCRYTGVFEKQNLQTILNDIQKDLKIDIINNNNTITFSGKGCAI